MFETFANNYIAEDERIDSRILDKFGKPQNGSRLWFACRRDWPLQQLTFNITAATPRKLCCLEEILLHIYQVMPDDPPDSQTIADELFIRERYFVDEVITDLIRLGILKVDSSGRTVITDLGYQCYARGEMPSMSRKQRISLCFDTVKHEFPDSLLFSDGSQSSSEGNNFQSIVRDYHVADANRIDLDTIRRAAASQGLLSSDNTVIFDAEPDEVEAEAEICWKEVVVFVFLDDRGRVNLRVHDPKSKSTTRWFQDAIDDRLRQGCIDFSYLFGSLASDIETTAGIDTNGDFAGMLRIPVHQVQEKILSAVDETDEFLSIQARGFGGSGNGHIDDLREAIRNAADRGVRCHLVWAGSKTDSNIPIHDNIEHRLVPAIEYEFLIADDIALIGLATEITLPTGSPAASILTVGRSSESSVRHRLKQRFLEKWEVAKHPVTETFAGSQAVSQNDNKQITNETTAGAVSTEKEA